MVNFRRLAFVVCMIFMSLPSAVAQQSERAEVLRRVIDGINSPDPVTRLVTFEEAMATDDQSLKQMALEAALASSDTSLRSTALSAAFSNMSSFVIELTAAPDEGGRVRTVLDHTAGRIEAQILEFDQSSGSFLLTSPFSKTNSDGRHITRGAINGNRVSFELNVQELHNTGAGYCRGSAKAEAGSTVLLGRVSCLEQPFQFQIDLLG